MRILLFFVSWYFVVVSHAQDTTRLSLLFAGDIMGHDSQIAAAYDSKAKAYDYGPCFQFIKPYLESVDLAIGNLELTLAGPPYKGYPQFSSPDALATTLKAIGFDVLVTANNHSVDRHKKGIERTIQVLDSLTIPHTGTFVDDMDRLNNYPLMLEKNGITLALLNYTYGTNGIPVPSPTIVNRIDTATIHKDLLRAREKQPDVIIVFTHWGAEYERLPRKHEKEVAALCFKYGADLVIGSHPHVLQPMEWNKEGNRLVVYSLGNFVSAQRKQYTDGGGMAYASLQKIRYKPDSTVTTIDSAGHYLHWVYRTVDSNRDYYMLPVSTFEKDTTGFIKDAASRVAFRTFINDSRELYGKYNKSVPEITAVPEDTVVTYRVLVDPPAENEVRLDSTSLNLFPPISAYVDTFYGYQLETDESNKLIIALGNFSTCTQAEKFCVRLIGEGKRAIVARYVNGKRSEE